MADNIESSGKQVLLIRHGETEWNRTRRFQGRSDVPLNQKGKNQGHALALALKDKPIKAIHSGPLILAMETARLIKVFHASITRGDFPSISVRKAHVAHARVISSLPWDG